MTLFFIVPIYLVQGAMLIAQYEYLNVGSCLSVISLPSVNAAETPVSCRFLLS